MDDFKEALKTGKLKEAFVLAMSKAVQLDITTSIVFPDSTNSGRLRTEINLVEGKIVNEISADLVGNKIYPEIQKLHFEQVAQGNRTLKENLESLEKTFKLMSALQQQVIEVPSRSLNNGDRTLLTPTEVIVEEEDDDDGEFGELISLVDLDPEEEKQGEDREDWGDWMEEKPPLDAPTMKTIPNISSLNLDDNEGWEEWEEPASVAERQPQ
jgi:hypothetical protein